VADVSKGGYFSKDDGFKGEQGSSGRRLKRRTDLIPGAPRTSHLMTQHGDPPLATPPDYGHVWPWIGRPWMQQQAMSQPPWVMATQSGPVTYPNP
jgi:hypothetical protein